MQIVKRFVIGIFLIYSPLQICAQDEVNTSVPKGFEKGIVMLNGRTLTNKVVKLSETELHYEIIGKKGKPNTSKAIDLNRIFSYPDANGEMHIHYTPNIEIGNDLNLSQMKKSIMGSVDARKNYDGRFFFFTGALVSYAAVFFDTYLYAGEAVKMNEDPNFPGSNYNPGPFLSEPSVFPVFIPLVFSIGTAIPKTRLQDRHVSYEKFKNDTYYQMGFERVARQKRVLNSVSGSIAGLALGYISYFIFKP